MFGRKEGQSYRIAELEARIQILEDVLGDMDSVIQQMIKALRNDQTCLQHVLSAQEMLAENDQMIEHFLSRKNDLTSLPAIEEKVEDDWN